MPCGKGLVLGVLGELVVKLTGDSSQLKSELSKANDSTNNVVNDIVNKVGGIAIAWKAVNLAVQGINYNALKEQAEIAFGVFLGSASAAKDMIQQLQQVALDTPLQFADVRDAGKQLLAYGVAANDLVPTIKMLTDVSAGLNIPVRDLAYLYGTVKTQGRAMTIDINQFANRGIPIWESLAKVTGKSGESLRSYVSAGQVGFPIIEKAFQNMTSEGGKFFGMASKQMDSFTGAESNLSDITSIFLSKMTAGMMDPLKSAMLSVTKTMTDSTKMAENFGATLGNVVSGVSVVLTTVTGILGAMPGQLGAIGTASLVAFAAFGPWGAAIAAALVSIGAVKTLMDQVATQNLQKLKDSFSGIGEQTGVIAANSNKFLENAKFAEVYLTQNADNTTITAHSFEVLGKQSGLTAVQVANIAINSDKTSKSTKLAAEQYLKQNGLTAIGLDNASKQAERSAKQVADGKLLEAQMAKIYPQQAAMALAQKSADAASAAAAAERSSNQATDLTNQKALSVAIKAINTLQSIGATQEKDALDQKIKLRNDYLSKLKEEFTQGKTTLDFVVSESKRINDLNADNSSELAKLDSVTKIAKAVESQVTNETEWDAKLSDQKTKNIESEKASALALAKSKNDSALDIYNIAKKYDDQLTQAYVESTNKDRLTAIAKAESLKDQAGGTALAETTYIQTVASINTFYDGQIVQFKKQRASDENSILSGSLTVQKKAWSTYYDGLKAQATDMTWILVDLDKAWKSVAMAGLEEVGKQLANGQGSWQAWEAVGLSAIGKVLEALGNQLIIMATVNMGIPGMQGLAAAEYAGAAAAFVAAGAMSSFASQINNTSSAATDATQSIDQLTASTKALSDLTERVAYMNSGGLASRIADQTANVAQATARLNAANAKLASDSVVKGSLSSSEASALSAKLNADKQEIAAAQAQLSDFQTQLGAATNAQATWIQSTSDSLKASIDTSRQSIQAYKIVMTEGAYSAVVFANNLNDIETEASKFQASLGSLGTDISKNLIDNLSKGLSEADFMSTMKDYLTGLVVQSAVYTDSLKDKMAKIGHDIGTAISGGISADSTASIVAELTSAYKDASTSATAATDIINKAFTNSDASIAASAKSTAKAASDAAKASAEALDAQYAATGQQIGNTFTQALEAGTSKADFTKSIGDMLRKMAIEAAVLAGGYADKFKAIGQQIADGIKNGLSDATLTSIKDQISTMYTEAQATTSTINSIFDSVPGFASGTNFAPGGLSLVGERGPELMNVPTGAQIIPAAQTSNIIRGDFGPSSRASNNNVNISVQSNSPLNPLQTANQIKMTMESLAFKGVI